MKLYFDCLFVECSWFRHIILFFIFFKGRAYDIIYSYSIQRNKLGNYFIINRLSHEMFRSRTLVFGVSVRRDTARTRAAFEKILEKWSSDNWSPQESIPDQYVPWHFCPCSIDNCYKNYLGDEFFRVELLRGQAARDILFLVLGKYPHGLNTGMGRVTSPERRP